MTEFAPAPGIELPTAPARRERLWRQSLSLVWRNKRALMLPMAVTQAPLTVLGAAATVAIYASFPDVEVDPFALYRPGDQDPGFVACMVGLLLIYLLFTMVGLGATMVAAKSLIEGKPITLAQSLDPAFTRMGAIVALGVFYYAVLVAGAVLAIVVIGPPLAMYALVRFGLAFQAIILDGMKVGVALRQSWHLLSTTKLRFLGNLLTVIPVALAAFIVTGAVFNLLVFPFTTTGGSRNQDVAMESIGMLFNGLTITPIAAYFATLTTLFYLNARRNQGA